MTVPTRRATVLMAVCAAVALGLGVLTRPAPTTLPSTGTGDAALAALGREVVGPDRPALAVAAVTPDRTRTAVLGAAPDARFEIGSITKGVTGLLFADMIARGEVAPTATVGALLPVEGPLAGVTVQQLATHRSGLPSVPGGVGPSLRGWWSALSAGNPYPYSTAQIVDAAVVTTPDALGPRDLTGETPGGRRVDPWAGEGIAPAGSVRADIADTARLARALLVGDAPGIDALLPRADLAPDRIGWGWLSRPDRVSGHTVVWHNGGTGGFTSFLGVDRHAGVAVVVLSAVGESPDTTTLAGFALLRRLSGAR